MLLSVFAGSGVQIFSCTVILMIFAVLGFLSPANRGGLLTAMLLLFVSCASFAGFWSARLYKMMGGKLWRRNTLLTALLYPGFVFAVFFVVNLFVWSAGSSGAVPFLTMFLLVVMWFGISVPLVSLFFFVEKNEKLMILLSLRHSWDRTLDLNGKRLKIRFDSTKFRVKFPTKLGSCNQSFPSWLEVFCHLVQCSLKCSSL